MDGEMLIIAAVIAGLFGLTLLAGLLAFALFSATDFPTEDEQ